MHAKKCQIYPKRMKTGKPQGLQLSLESSYEI